MNAPNELCGGQPAKNEGYEFYFQTIDTLVFVQNCGGSILIRATEDTFSDRRKEKFIRELAMEGFIPDEYYFLNLGGPAIQWITDRSWLKLDEVATAKVELLSTRIAVGAGLCWALLMICLRAHPVSTASSANPSRYAAHATSARAPVQPNATGR